MKTIALATSAIGIAALLATPAFAQRTRGVAGTLTCEVAPGVGLIVASQKALACRFVSVDRRRSERYRGSITKVGLDIGVTGRSVIVWNVLADTRSLRRGALAGNYGGVTAQATVGVGAGANVLVGGSRNTVTLQPVSVSVQTGANLAAGVGSLSLRAVR